ncbi:MULTISPECIES: Uma2 family endonuclease [Nostoc]|uniref:Uma2 family endonuclease n=1 Tax=Nostoc paludosum FACHB-159 TaxID=2692908 RepID=A0ABR8K6X5_9NOSO|nr:MULTISPECIES: Uma2 family endonuclease [Nostoc]MBD2678864.1 Uma2 family endonuclease [Nostoc sp. FACHB-857]MBD2735242.1 Uma2 family endonuclease [Nostoc paludosum FACHB-159]
MTSNTLIQPTEIIHLSGISWQTYENLLAELSVNRRLRLTYNRGTLEIMVPSPEHERYKRIASRFVETLAEELEIRIDCLGSTTFKRPELSGAEPDECFYIGNINAIKGKKRIDLAEDPPPDLVVEVDITSSSKNRFQVYADMGVPEIWRYDGKTFTINVLENQKYISVQQSLAFPNLPLIEISHFLKQVGEKDYLELVKEFRQWVKSQI